MSNPSQRVQTAFTRKNQYCGRINRTIGTHIHKTAPLYDSGEADSFLYYVMPYVVGESLRQKLNREKQLSRGPHDFDHAFKLTGPEAKVDGRIAAAQVRGGMADFGDNLPVTESGDDLGSYPTIFWLRRQPMK